MFKIVNKEISITRGDAGTVVLTIPETDYHGYLKYKNIGGDVFWYDLENTQLYTATYIESTVDITTLTLQLYSFQVNDVVVLKVFTKKALEGEPLIKVEVTVGTEATYVNIPLTSTDTTVGDYINKPLKCWYEIELNGDQTVIGYDEDGPKLFYLYPEGDGIDD